LVTWAWLPHGKVKVSKIDSALTYIPPVITKKQVYLIEFQKKKELIWIGVKNAIMSI
jgi:hypothetical protein